MVIRRVTREHPQHSPPEDDLPLFSQREEHASGPPEIPSVGELTAAIRAVLETGFDDVAVRGEISSWRRYDSGHTYFTIKDEHAVLNGVVWRNTPLRHEIGPGMSVVATGRISVYPPRGAYQLSCTSIAPLGVGALQQAFERLRQRLAGEGLFDPERKRPIPNFPRRVGIVTSKNGAALHDILTVLRRRMPLIEVILRSALVQGAGAAEDIARGIEELNDRGGVDVIIVGRGGGSIEDLWAFNEEVVARAIAGSQVPVVSAVGHEVDVTIADYVADLRAPTPTAAAELIVRDRSELIALLHGVEARLTGMITDRLSSERDNLERLLRRAPIARPLDMLHHRAQRLDELAAHLPRRMERRLERLHERIESRAATLRALDPSRVLERGYAIVERNTAVVGSAGTLSPGDALRIHLHDGTVEATVTSATKTPPTTTRS